MLNNVHVMFRN